MVLVFFPLKWNNLKTCLKVSRQLPKHGDPVVTILEFWWRYGTEEIALPHLSPGLFPAKHDLWWEPTFHFPLRALPIHGTPSISFIFLCRHGFWPFCLFVVLKLVLYRTFTSDFGKDLSPFSKTKIPSLFPVGTRSYVVEVCKKGAEKFEVHLIM